MNKINAALVKANGDVKNAIQILIDEKQADANEMANRATSAAIVHSYVHNHRVGAMIVIACQTDFSAKNELFLNLAKDICMHIVSTPVAPIYVEELTVPSDTKEALKSTFIQAATGKPVPVIVNIVEGKMRKWCSENCLYNQPFVKDDTKTIGELIKGVSSTIGEKIEVKHFVKVVAK